MKFEVNVSRLARRDFTRTAAWYERQTEGLGDRFNIAADSVIARIVTTPTAHPFYCHPIRRVMITPFKNAAFFRVSGKLISIIAVIDLRGDPETISRKLRGR